MLMQILVGVFLEMEQEGWMGSLRVASVYLTGVLAGSVGTSISGEIRLRTGYNPFFL